LHKAGFKLKDGFNQKDTIFGMQGPCRLDQVDIEKLFKDMYNGSENALNNIK